MRKVFSVGLVAAAALLVPAGPALAIHCKVADKPLGAGAADPEEWKVTPSGKLVLPGAFVNLTDVFPGAPNEDVFIRGPEAREIGEETGIVGFGSLPPQPHENGPPDHGVTEVPFGGP